MAGQRGQKISPEFKESVIRRMMPPENAAVPQLSIETGISKEQAEFIRNKLEQRLKQCKLSMHPEKTKIAYCKDSNRRENHENIQFTFLGYTYRPRKAKSEK